MKPQPSTPRYLQAEPTSTFITPDLTMELDGDESQFFNKLMYKIGLY